jgi:hypothetical protein
MSFKNDPLQLTRHHIDPRSRQRKGIIGVSIVPRYLHEVYHQLFGNMRPSEIIEWLNKTFWNDMFQITITKRPP